VRHRVYSVTFSALSMVHPVIRRLDKKGKNIVWILELELNVHQNFAIWPSSINRGFSLEIGTKYFIIYSVLVETFPTCCFLSRPELLMNLAENSVFSRVVTFSLFSEMSSSKSVNIDVFLASAFKLFNCLVNKLHLNFGQNHALHLVKQTRC
jgi:hypothetical protein